MDHHLRLRVSNPRYLDLTRGGRPDRGVAQAVLTHGATELRLRERAKAARSAGKGGACAPVAPEVSVEDDVDLLPVRRRTLERVMLRFRGPQWMQRLWRLAIVAVNRRVGFTFDEGECVHWMIVYFARRGAAHLRGRRVAVRSRRPC